MIQDLVKQAQPAERWLAERQNGHAQRDERPLSEQTAQALHDLGYTFTYNHVTQSIEVNGRALDDYKAAEIRMRMRDRGFKQKQAIEDVYMVMARRRAYHPIRDYLDGLQWNGETNIANLAAHFTCDDPPILNANGTENSLFSTYLRRWAIGAVAKVYEHGQNMMLVLAGAQGIGKSYFASWLCSPLRPYFVSQAINAEDKDSALRLTRHFLWEVDELDGTIRRSDVAALKGFITKQTIVARPAYARHDVELPSIASLIGTVNIGAGFLADATGNRRFYVATISTINWMYTKTDIDQFWAEVVTLYKAGEPWMLQPSEKAAQVETNKRHEVPSLLDDWIETDLYFDAPSTTGMTAADIVFHLRSRNHYLSGTERSQAMAIAEVMTKRGVVKRRIDNIWHYMGIAERADDD